MPSTGCVYKYKCRLSVRRGPDGRDAKRRKNILLLVIPHLEYTTEVHAAEMQNQGIVSGML